MILKPLAFLVKLAKELLYPCLYITQIPTTKIFRTSVQQFQQCCEIQRCDMSSTVVNRSVMILKLQLQWVQCRKGHRDGNRTFSWDCPLYPSPVLRVFYRRLPASVGCVPILASTRCGFSRLRWELKEVARGSCFPYLFSKSC